jgi:hypothetical protein
MSKVNETWYRVRARWLGMPFGLKAIEPVDVEKATEEFVFTRHGRMAKRSRDERMFPTWAEARLYLVGWAQGEVSNATRQLDAAMAIPEEEPS